MSATIAKVKQIPAKGHIAVLAGAKSDFGGLGLSGAELAWLKAAIRNRKAGRRLFAVNQYKRWVFVCVPGSDSEGPAAAEAARRAGNEACRRINAEEIAEVTLTSRVKGDGLLAGFAEGMALGNYQFNRYFSDGNKKENTLKRIVLHSAGVRDVEVAELRVLLDAVGFSRDLVNEPHSWLTAEKLASGLRAMSGRAGIRAEVFNKKKIEALKMGGLLAVNKGSLDPPTFTVMEWKPAGAKNKKPVVLVGKGVVFDTGGLSLKPTPNSMDQMKCDMAGAAAVAGAIYAIAAAKLPAHVVALVPATDNRPGGNAYVPGDVVCMYDGSTVEVLNTDAEGRMILADALAYAKKYNPALVVDAATLTGAAMRATGIHAVVAMGKNSAKEMGLLKDSGECTFERIIELPLWEEYADDIKSQVADVKNVGGALAGAITAGKFLERFTDYPWIHLDIAGPAFLGHPNEYKGPGGTGVGVRLLFDFVKRFAGLN